ncbi:MAG: hypothetical protein ACXWCB_00425 [Acidimicrobiales bacterium]
MPTAPSAARRVSDSRCWWRRAVLGLAAALERLDDDLLLLCDCSEAGTCDGHPVVVEPAGVPLPRQLGL